MGFKTRTLQPFQNRNIVTVSIWDIPLWDKARQVAIAEHCGLSTLVYQAMKAFLADKEMPEWGRVRDPKEYTGVDDNWRVKRMKQLDESVKTGKKPERKLDRSEEVYLETQKWLKESAEEGRPAPPPKENKNKRVFEKMLAEGEAEVKKIRGNKGVK